MNRSLPERNSQHMNAALAAAPPATDAITLPLVLTVALATVALVAIAVSVRRMRQTARLTGVTAAASGVSVFGILVSALLVSVALGNASIASASDAATGGDQIAIHSPGQLSPQPAPPTTGDLSGPQLPTK